MKKKKNITQKIEILKDINLVINKNIIILEYKGKEIKRKLYYPGIHIRDENNTMIISSEKNSRNEKKIINTYKAHIKNMIRGLVEGYTYKLKICSSHFPMNVSLDNNKLIIKNFFGEKVPRKAKILEGVDVKIEGDIITVTGVDKEKVGQTSANMEKSTRITNRDRRVFMDGIYIIDKGGRKIH